MDRSHWQSPSFRERTPRFRGDGGFRGPRHFSPHWRPRNPSPYRSPSPFGGGGSPLFSPHQRSPYDSPSDFMTSTPYQHSPGGGHRPFHHRGRGGGGGRFNRRHHSFGQPSHDKSSGDDIDNWISPEMWSDPWSHLIPHTTAESSATPDKPVEPESSDPDPIKPPEEDEETTNKLHKDLNISESIKEGDGGDDDDEEQS